MTPLMIDGDFFVQLAEGESAHPAYVRAKNGQLANHLEFGEVRIQHTDELGWHYVRWGFAGHGNDWGKVRAIRVVSTPLAGEGAPTRALVEAISALDSAHVARELPCYAIARDKLTTLREKVLALQAGIKAEDREPTGADFKRLMYLLNLADRQEHEHRFDFEIDTGKYTILIDRAGCYGYFEHNRRGEDSAGGLWFEVSAESTGGDAGRKLELTDYDGVMCLPADVRFGLRESGFIVDETFD